MCPFIFHIIPLHSHDRLVYGDLHFPEICPKDVRKWEDDYILMNRSFNHPEYQKWTQDILYTLVQNDGLS